MSRPWDKSQYTEYSDLMKKAKALSVPVRKVSTSGCNPPLMVLL